MVTVTRKQFDDALLDEATRAAETMKASGASEDRCDALMRLLLMHGELIGRKLFGQRTPDNP